MSTKFLNDIILRKFFFVGMMDIKIIYKINFNCYCYLWELNLVRLKIKQGKCTYGHNSGDIFYRKRISIKVMAFFVNHKINRGLFCPLIIRARGWQYFCISINKPLENRGVRRDIESLLFNWNNKISFFIYCFHWLPGCYWRLLLLVSVVLLIVEFCVLVSASTG